MRRLKLFVLLSVTLAAILFYGYRDSSTTARAGGYVPSAPTGVSASNNDYANKVGIMWDSMRGATVYRVFRNTVNDPATATDIGTSVSNDFYDMTAVPATTYFYWVRAESPNGNSGMSPAVQGVRGVLGESPGPFTPQEPPPSPVGNQLTAAKTALGKALFWDEQLSSTGTVACGTCHRPAEGGSDPRTVIGDIRSRHPGHDNIPNTPDDVFGSPGVPMNNLDGTYTNIPFYGFRPQVTNRKAPSYLNGGYSLTGLFWDGRANNEFRDPVTDDIILISGGSYESQVLFPPVSDAEMGHAGRDWPQVAARIAASKPLALASDIPASLVAWIDGRSYPELFEEAFGTPEVTPSRIAMAIASHERHLITDRTPFDRWAAGMGGLTTDEAAGAILFFGKQCNQCHSDSIFSDNFFHNIGVSPQSDDPGRGGITGEEFNLAEFKTPNLRNVELHAPYMHNGKFATLEEVIDFYNRGGDFDAPNIDRGLIRPMGITPEEKAQMVAFMKRPLTDPRVVNELPPFDRPQLYTESKRVPVISGTGRAGSGAIVPNAIAIEPPLVGNDSFSIAVDQGLGGANAVVVISSSDPGVGTTIPASGSFARVQTSLAGTGAGNGTGSVSLAIPDDQALVGQTFYGRWYVTDAAAANGFSVSKVFSFTVFGEGSVQPDHAAFVDFDGDGKTDVSVFRPSNGQWWYTQSSDGVTPGFAFGGPGDQIVPGDYTGDGKTDIAIFRPSISQWFILQSEDHGYYAFNFGSPGDKPVTGDFDGDGKDDPAVFRESNGQWYVLRSSDGGVTTEVFGGAGDIPQVGDYDGDGLADIAVFRPLVSGAQWWVKRSSAGLFATQFGLSTDKPVAADYTGDGKTDVAFWRPGTGYWYILQSEDYGYYAFPFGGSGDIPAPGDYDGDGKTDAGIFRPSDATWYMMHSTGGIGFATFGMTGDKPVPSAYVP